VVIDARGLYLYKTDPTGAFLMKTEIQTAVEEIRDSLGLLRRHL
jgi:hypothetical protein